MFSEIYSKFYINEKFYNNNAYKKLFAPKSPIRHKSSLVDVSFDYAFEQTKSRKMLRIMVTIKNTSNSTLRELTCFATKDNPKLMACKPQKIFISELHSSQTVHQVLYLSEYNPNFYYIPLTINFITESNSSKQIIIPVSIDIMKFLQKTKINYDKIIDNTLDIKRTFYLKNKSEIPFTNAL